MLEPNVVVYNAPVHISIKKKKSSAVVIHSSLAYICTHIGRNMVFVDLLCLSFFYFFGVVAACHCCCRRSYVKMVESIDYMHCIWIGFCGFNFYNIWLAILCLICTHFSMKCSTFFRAYKFILFKSNILFVRRKQHFISLLPLNHQLKH